MTCPQWRPTAVGVAGAVRGAALPVLRTGGSGAANRGSGLCAFGVEPAGGWQCGTGGRGAGLLTHTFNLKPMFRLLLRVIASSRSGSYEVMMPCVTLLFRDDFQQLEDLFQQLGPFLITRAPGAIGQDGDGGHLDGRAARRQPRRRRRQPAEVRLRGARSAGAPCHLNSITSTSHTAWTRKVTAEQQTPVCEALGLPVCGTLARHAEPPTP